MASQHESFSVAVQRLPSAPLRPGQMMVMNGLTEAILGFNPNAPWECTTPLSQADTLFKNNRWYLISNMRQLLNEIYVEHGIVQTIIDVPVDDALRGGLIIKSKQMSPEEIEKVSASMDRENDVGNLGQSGKWDRLFGGAGILILTDQDPSTPLNINKIRKDSPMQFRAVDMWEIFYDMQNLAGFDAAIGDIDFQFYSYYGIKVHKSRILAMKGMTAPSFIRPRLRGWGFTVIESMVRSINQYLKATDLMFEVLDEFKIDVYKLKDLASTLLMADGQAQVQQRVQLTNLQKNFQNAVTLDAEDDFEQRELTFAGIQETFQGIREQIAADVRMPVTKIFGSGSKGFSSGEDDIENYNSMIESQVRSKLKNIAIKMIEIRCQKELGYVPTDITIEYKPLRMLSSVDEENVKTQKFQRVFQAASAGLMTPEEFKNACNKDNLLGIQVDASIERLDIGIDPDEDTEGPKDEDDGDPQDDAPNRPDSSRVSPKILKD